MTYMNWFIDKFKEHIQAGLEAKTGWGKNEVYVLILECISKAQADTMKMYYNGEQMGR